MTCWNLLLLRHGKSSWADPKLADMDRPLKKRGRRDSSKIGHFLKTEDLTPQCILSSQAQRARQTVIRVCKGLSFPKGDIHWRTDLYHASREIIHQILGNQPALIRCILIVGHNPGFEEYLDWLIPGICWPSDGKLLPTAALAQLTAAVPYAHWQPGNVSLHRITRPRHR